MKAVQSQVITDTAAIWGDCLVVGNTAELEHLLQASEIFIGDANSLFISQPFIYVLVIGITTLCRTFSCNEDKLYIIHLSNLGPLLFTALNVRTARTATHSPEVDN